MSEFQRQQASEKYGEKNSTENTHLLKLSKNEIIGSLSQEWEKFAIHMAKHWFGLVDGWARNFERREEGDGRLKIVCYENLLENPKFTILTVMKFLGFGEEIEKRSHCLDSEVEGDFHRKREFSSYEVYNDDMMRVVVGYVLEARRILKERNLKDCFDGFRIPGEIIEKFGV